jgi:hypothetical protein
MYSSRWFGVGEFACHDGTKVPAAYVDTNLAALASQLDLIRDAWGSRIEVVSGYRTALYNALIKGAPKSLHVHALAADVRPVIVRDGHRIRWDMLQPAERAKIADDFRAVVDALMAVQSLPLVGGVGWYAGKWIHVDVRAKPPDGHIARWEGAGIGAEMIA